MHRWAYLDKPDITKVNLVRQFALSFNAQLPSLLQTTTQLPGRACGPIRRSLPYERGANRLPIADVSIVGAYQFDAQPVPDLAPCQPQSTNRT